MQVATFDTETLRLMTLFENITHTTAKDCVEDAEGKCVYFLVREGKVGSAIGKNGVNVKKVEATLKKDVKILEYSEDLDSFVKKIIPQAKEVRISEEDGAKRVEVKVDNGKKAIVIGREGRNLRLFKELLRRNHDVNDLIVR